MIKAMDSPAPAPDPAPDANLAPPPLPPPRNIRLITLPAHDCNYLPGRQARSRAFMAQQLDPSLYHQLMDAGFRRSGQLIYQPICPTCRACVPLRVRTDRFTRSKSQRRIWRRNQDLIVQVAGPLPTDEKLAVYQRYLALRHDDAQGADADSFLDFLYASPLDTLEFTYRDRAGTLVGVGICDICPQSLSSVYFFFDPAAAKRSLGTFAALWEVTFARERSIPYYYLGYWIAGCGTMDYKAQFRPNELLGPDGVWRENEAVSKT